MGITDLKNSNLLMDNHDQNSTICKELRIKDIDEGVFSFKNLIENSPEFLNPKIITIS